MKRYFLDDSSNVDTMVNLVMFNAKKPLESVDEVLNEKGCELVIYNEESENPMISIIGQMDLQPISFVTVDDGVFNEYERFFRLRSYWLRDWGFPCDFADINNSLYVRLPRKSVFFLSTVFLELAYDGGSYSEVKLPIMICECGCSSFTTAIKIVRGPLRREEVDDFTIIANKLMLVCASCGTTGTIV